LMRRRINVNLFAVAHSADSTAQEPPILYNLLTLSLNDRDFFSGTNPCGIRLRRTPGCTSVCAAAEHSRGRLCHQGPCSHQPHPFTLHPSEKDLLLPVVTPHNVGTYTAAPLP
jgi:hypothetical protein